MEFIEPGKYIAGFQVVPDEIPGFGHIDFNQVKISMRVHPFLEKEIRAARAMGLSEKLVIKKHILKKCLVSIFQHIPVVMTYVLSNLLMVEWLLDYKGAAWRFLYAIQRIQVPKK